MKRRLARILRLVLLLSTALVMLQACGHGGTEVGNPPAPQAPSDSDGGGPTLHPDQGETSPTPSPDANLNLDEMEAEI
ncbi:MAG TPA: hypothetical protein VJR29_02480 [bacterium]|nr:hypothetical protein [bacterium]